MVPGAALDAWRLEAPWPSEVDIEQDLILSRLIVDVARHPLLGSELAFRGGTCLHKLHAPRASRYSNDLDYVRTTTGPIQGIMAALREVVLATGVKEADYEQKRDAVSMRFDALPTSGLGRIRVKIEINTRETTPLLDHVRLPFRIDNPWFAGHTEVLTFELAELLGTKLRALYQRRKGRDLFDLWLGLEELEVAPDRVIAAFHHYLGLAGTVISRTDFERNLADKLDHRGFRSDLDQLLVELPVGYDIDAAAELVRERLLALLD